VTDPERRTIRLVRASFADPPVMDTAVSHALLRRASDGLEPETLRLHRPGRVVAFGPLDRLAAGFPDAIESARAQGFEAVQRLAGGRAAVFHEETIAFAWVIPDRSPRTGITPRFDTLAEIMAGAFRDIGVDARTGEVPGEYCPGSHSVNARGRTKVMGVGQRVLSGAAHVGGVVVVGGSDRVRDVLVPVYRALGLAWDPRTSGSLQDEVPGVTWDAAVEAIVRRFTERFHVVDGSLDDAVLHLARELAPMHRARPPDPAPHSSER
jgi:octanoyl-[GcvH]:protein N-octanoyltransferase